MKVLVVGGGGREHALAWKIAKSERVSEVIAAPGNAGMADVARCVAVGAEDVDALVDLARHESVGLVVVGPEAPLVAGLSNRLREEGIPVFGPSAKAAVLEGSKVFAKQFMDRHSIPTAAFSVHSDLGEALEEVRRRDGRCVVKADGLAAGKGVIVCQELSEAEQALRTIMEDRAFGEAGAQVLIEDLLVGEEASMLAICDGERFVPLLSAQDHKAAFEGDTGPNTGGMGAYAPAPLVTDELRTAIIEQVIKPTVQGMKQEDCPFSGVLYAGIMVCDGKPYVLEYNVRFGDPECQPLLAMLDEDLVPILEGAAKGTLEERELAWHNGSVMCVVLAAGGYPGAYEKGKVISGLQEAADVPNVVVFHAGTKLVDDNIVTAGGRVLGVTARGSDLAEAANNAYEGAGKISWDGMRMRRDIGHRAL